MSKSRAAPCWGTAPSKAAWRRPVICIVRYTALSPQDVRSDEDDLEMKRKVLEKVAASKPTVEKPEQPVWHREPGPIEWLERFDRKGAA